jgi:hypothetical protein
VPALADYDDGETIGMMIGRGNRSSWKKPAPVPLSPPQTPHACPDATNRLSCGTAFIQFRDSPHRKIFPILNTKKYGNFCINIIPFLKMSDAGTGLRIGDEKICPGASIIQKWNPQIMLRHLLVLNHKMLVCICTY